MGMASILLAHCEIKRFDSPEVEPYERYQPKLQARSSALVQEWCDIVGFANYKTIVKSSDVGFNNKVSRGISTGERLLHTSEKPAYLAKTATAYPIHCLLTGQQLADAMTTHNRTNQPNQRKIIMAALNFNAAKVEPQQSFDALPPGRYEVIISESEMKDTKAGTGQYLQLTWTVVGGQHEGRKLWSRLNLVNPNATAVSIAERELSAICHCVGILVPQDSEELHDAR
jgi:hypothetical protein